MPGLVEQHHHRNTTKVSQKPFKPRFLSRNALKEKAKGKVESSHKGTRKTPHQQVMSKFDRKNQAKQKRIASNRNHAKANSVFFGKNGAPRVVAVIPLCEDISASQAVTSLTESLNIDQVVESMGITSVEVDRFKQKIQYFIVRRDLIAIMDACRVADYVLFLLSTEEEVDEEDQSLIRCVEGQGVSNVYTAVQGLEKIPHGKKRTQTLHSLKSFITHFFPDQEKVFSLDLPQECQNLIRSLCTTTPRGIKWREDRSWMLVEDVRWQDVGDETMSAVVTGVIRGQNLKADRLVQLGDWGEFQIERIVASPREAFQRGEEQAMNMNVDRDLPEPVLDTPTADRDALEDLAPEEVVMEDKDGIGSSINTIEQKGVLLDDERDFEHIEDGEEDQMPRKLPRGTSRYQAAWYLGDVSDSGSDLDDDESEEMEGDVAMRIPSNPEDGLQDDSAGYNTYNAALEPSEYPQSEIFVDQAPEEEAEAEELEAFRASKKTEAQEHLEYPDEVELHPKVLARERLAQYRGLKSLRMSPWNYEEDTRHQPNEWPRLLEINDYKGAKSRVLRESLVGGVRPGTRVQVRVGQVPISCKELYDKSEPLGLFSLLRHEHKRTAVNFSITLDSSREESLKSKEGLIMQCGPRRFFINPLFSQPGTTPNDVHKFERFLHPGRTAVASFTAPLTWGSVPTLFFEHAEPATASISGDATNGMDVDASSARPHLRLIAHGTSLPPSTTRVIAKRIVLTGQPFKIHRRLVTVRYMFFNAEDVEWFRALPLWTNRGSQGAFKESLGTHGYFKAVFDKKIGMMDAVGVSLYKRLWPKPAARWSSEIAAAP